MVTMAAGISDEELARIEGEFGFEFADDHRAFLSSGLPVGGFVAGLALRAAPESAPTIAAARRRHPVRCRMAGLLGGFRLGGCAPGPDEGRVAQRELPPGAGAQLVPLHANHYLPAGGRGMSGHPVLSIYQTDVSCCAADIFDYGNPDPARKSASTVPFWSDLIG